MGEAVASVLAQTYRPLEVLVTDDASGDGTFEMAQTVARSYHGPHRVILFQSERNRDILAHWNDAVEFIRGDFFLSLSGDDVAEADQAERLVAAWTQMEGASCAWSNYRAIDESGNDLGVALPETHPYSLGLRDYADGRFLDFPYSGICGYARSVLDDFGCVPDHLGSRGLEHYLGFRAALLGPKVYVPEALMRRRHHPNRATAGLNWKDREIDPMVVHERQVRVRLQVLTGCRDAVAGMAEHAVLAQALASQIDNEVNRLREFERYRERGRRMIESGFPAARHSGYSYPPNALTLVRTLPEYQCNILAGECKYFLAPWQLGELEPCAVRNGIHANVVGAWSEEELLQKLRDGAHRPGSVSV